MTNGRGATTNDERESTNNGGGRLTTEEGGSTTDRGAKIKECASVEFTIVKGVCERGLDERGKEEKLGFLILEDGFLKI